MHSNTIGNKTIIKEHEYLLDQRLMKFISRTAPDYIVEVGSFDGRNLKVFSQESPYSKAIGFEANPTNFFNLCLGKNIQHLAVSNFDGNIKFYEGSENSLRTKKNVSIFKRIEYSNFIEYNVPCVTLDSFFESEINKNKTFVLIIDAEGATYEVLAGAQRVLKNTLAIKVEVEFQKFWKDQKTFSEYDFLLNALLLVGDSSASNNKQSNYYYVKDLNFCKHFRQY